MLKRLEMKEIGKFSSFTYRLTEKYWHKEKHYF